MRGRKGEVVGCGGVGEEEEGAYYTGRFRGYPEMESRTANLRALCIRNLFPVRFQQVNCANENEGRSASAVVVRQVYRVWYLGMWVT